MARSRCNLSGGKKRRCKSKKRRCSRRRRSSSPFRYCLPGTFGTGLLGNELKYCPSGGYGYGGGIAGNSLMRYMIMQNAAKSSLGSSSSSSSLSSP